MPAVDPGICANISATYSEGPPMRVVPVSMAAYEPEPDGRLTEVPCTVMSAHNLSGRRQHR